MFSTIKRILSTQERPLIAIGKASALGIVFYALAVAYMAITPAY